MALFYQIVFPEESPSAEILLQEQIAEWADSYQLKNESPNRFVVLRDGELIVSITVSNERDFFDLALGEYFFNIDWYVEIGKADGLAGMQFYVTLLGRVISGYGGDFLSVFNGELVVVKRDNTQIHLNTESSIWKKPRNLTILANHPYDFVTYSVE